MVGGEWSLGRASGWIGVLWLWQPWLRPKRLIGVGEVVEVQLRGQRVQPWPFLCRVEVQQLRQ